jgi:putative flavoprotein involved in K+ transport
MAGVYRLSTPQETILARCVVIASGASVRPRLPPSATSLRTDLVQFHSTDYRNPAGLPEDAVLIVGAGTSGCQIAEDLLGAGRTVYLATCRAGRLPRRYRGRDTIAWAHETGFADERVEDLVDRSVIGRGRPQVSAGHTVSLQSLSARGVTLLSRFVGVEGSHLRFADDLAENIAFADRASAAAKRRIDADIEPAETVIPRLPDPPILSLDPAARGVSAVIWCTGLDGDFGWVRLPGVLDEKGKPVQEQGVTAWAGLRIQVHGAAWLSRDARYAGFHPASLRRSLMDRLSVAMRTRLGAKCRTTAMFLAPCPLRRRDWSSPKTTSSTQWRRFSMPQWPRMAWPARSAVRRAEEM